MKPVIKSVLASAILCTTINATHAADICEAEVLHNVSPREGVDSVSHKGEILGSITQYVVDKETKRGYFCQHGGYCYPRYVDGVEVVRLTNCKIGKVFSNDPRDSEIFHHIDVVRSKNTKRDLMFDDVSSKLMDLGMIQLNADHLAYIYVHKPNSTCGKLVKKALHNDFEAVGILARQKKSELGDYCKISGFAYDPFDWSDQ